MRPSPFVITSSNSIRTFPGRMGFWLSLIKGRDVMRKRLQRLRKQSSCRQGKARNLAYSDIVMQWQESALRRLRYLEILRKNMPDGRQRAPILLGSMRALEIRTTPSAGWKKTFRTVVVR